MAYRNKTYIAFDGDNDMMYYTLMNAWKQKDNSTFNFYDAHDLNTARDSSQEESIKRQLRFRMENSKVFVLLIGTNTKYLYKFVKWEIETAIKMNLPIICVNLNKNKSKDNLCPASLENQLAIFIPYEKKIMEYALENWSSHHYKFSRESKIGAYYYEDSVYNRL
ncbi:molecular chaperone Tir [Listeria monocytogenes]|uniref:TIR domain-containing protein n=1 Tax=Listeria monocytogenes TaxID=1639 RepID=UPI00086DD86B|nr:TIR domain-containing protein [Listeria monocytogenes]EAC2905073.1 molecular chaperone Tir [Listeria monocytogenes]EAD5761595.1 molecular chaperone Tir [Listeria monocytogenes]EAG6652819.1 molecular chaperone Tir [Listeria monocytogenes]EAG6894265.1 molecular chaperone Tir [Listeria monocytogenes]EAG9056186.1 molecular chaperone Tir [Listeria monocytogenes]